MRFGFEADADVRNRHDEGGGVSLNFPVSRADRFVTSPFKPGVGMRGVVVAVETELGPRHAPLQRQRGEGE